MSQVETTHADSSPPAPVHRRTATWHGLVLFFTFLLYAPAIQNDYAWDDRQAAQAVDHHGRNPNVAELHGLSYYFTTGYWPNKDPGSPNYRPFTVLSFGLGHALFGDSAAAAHLWTVLAHVLATWLAFLVLRGLGSSGTPACLGALLFGVHAIHAEAVCSIVGRAESLSFACGAAAFLAARMASLTARGGQPGFAQWRWLALAGIGLFAACCFKESGIAWAGFIPIGLWLGRTWGFDRVGGATLAVALLVPAVAFVALRANFLAGIPDTAMGYFENPHLHTDTTTRLLSSLVVWGYAALVTILPWRLALDHGIGQFPIVAEFTDPWSMVALLVLGVFVTGLVFAWRWRRTHPMHAIAIVSFLGFSFIVSNIAFPVYVVFAERTHYAACFAMSLVVCGLAAQLRTRPHPVWILLLGGLVGFHATKVWDRHPVWHDDISMIEHEVLANPNALRIVLAAGQLCVLRGDHGSAHRHYEHGTRIDPEEPQAWIGLAEVLFHRGERAAAGDAIDRATALPPHRFHPSLRQQGWILSARIHAVTGKWSTVCYSLEQSVAADPRPLQRAEDLTQAIMTIANGTKIADSTRRRLRRVLERAGLPAKPPGR